MDSFPCEPLEFSIKSCIYRLFLVGMEQIKRKVSGLESVGTSWKRVLGLGPR